MKIKTLNTKTKILGGVVIPNLFAISVGGIGIFNIKSARRTEKFVNHTHNVLTTSDEIILSPANMETGMYGHLLSGRDELLTPYNNGRETFCSKLSKLKKLANDNSAQVEHFDKMDRLFSIGQPKLKMLSFKTKS